MQRHWLEALIVSWLAVGACAESAGEAAATGDRLVPVALHNVPNARLTGLWGSADDDIWAIGSRSVGDGQEHTETSILICRPDRWLADNVVVHYDGAAWSNIDSGTQTYLSDIDGSSARDVWMVGMDGGVFHRDGATFRKLDISAAAHHDGDTSPCREISLQAVSVLAPDDVWVVGYIHPSAAGPGLVLHFDGAQWKRFPVDAGDGFFAVRALSAQDVWAVGSSGIAYHYDGSAFTRSTVPTDQYLFSLFSYAGHEVWTAGNEGAVLHFDGTAWSDALGHAFSGAVRGLSGTGPSDLWAAPVRPLAADHLAAPAQHVAHWNGERWSLRMLMEEPDLTDLWVSPSGQVWSVGSTIARLR